MWVVGWLSFGLLSCVLYWGVCPIRKRLVICKLGERGGLERRVGAGMGIVLGPVGFWIAGLRGPRWRILRLVFGERDGWLKATVTRQFRKEHSSDLLEHKHIPNHQPPTVQPLTSRVGKLVQTSFPTGISPRTT